MATGSGGQLRWPANLFRPCPAHGGGASNAAAITSLSKVDKFGLIRHKWWRPRPRKEELATLKIITRQAIEPAGSTGRKIRRAESSAGVVVKTFLRLVRRISRLKIPLSLEPSFRGSRGQLNSGDPEFLAAPRSGISTWPHFHVLWMCSVDEGFCPVARTGCRAEQMKQHRTARNDGIRAPTGFARQVFKFSRTFPNPI